MTNEEHMEKMRLDMHVFERLSNADCAWLLDRIAKLETVAEAAVDEAETHHPECECPLCSAVAGLENTGTEGQHEQG